MHRRTFVQVGIATPLAIGALGFLAGCAAVAGAEPYLQLVAKEAAKGFGMLVGTQAGSDVQDLGEQALSWLQEKVDAEARAAVQTFAPTALTANPLRTLVAAAFKVNNELQGHAVILNGDEFVKVPAAVALGMSFYASRRLGEWRAANHGASPGADRNFRASLRAGYSIRKLQRSDGSDALTEKSVYDSLTTNNRNLRVTWDPTTDEIEQSRLHVQEGLLLKGRDPSWSRSYERGIPSDLLWDTKG